jgi:hypothetical protein
MRYLVCLLVLAVLPLLGGCFAPSICLSPSFFLEPEPQQVDDWVPARTLPDGAPRGS